MTIDPNVSGSSANQIVAVGVHRTGTDIVLRWRLLIENGSDTTLYFDHGGEGPVEQVLNLTPIPPGTTTYTIAEQSLANQSGAFLTSQNDGSGESGYNEGVNLPKVYVEFMQCISCSGDDDDDDEPPDPTYYVFYDSYHHRDHLGTLRLVTNSVGALASAHDYYPFGTEMTGGLPPEGLSHLRYTGHERDGQSGLDYMSARFYSGRLARFLAVDPSRGSVRNKSPQSWNRYPYVDNDPVAHLDPDGRRPRRATLPRRNLTLNDLTYRALARELERITGTPEVTMRARENHATRRDIARMRQRVSNARYRSQLPSNRDPAMRGLMKDWARKWGPLAQRPYTIRMRSSGEAHDLARKVLGSGSREVEPGKWRSENGAWQARYDEGHINLERIDPSSGRVVENIHLVYSPKDCQSPPDAAPVTKPTE